MCQSRGTINFKERTLSIITNQMLPDGRTKCWDSKGVYYVLTDPSQIRKKGVNHIYAADHKGKDETRGNAQPPTYGPHQEVFKKGV
jgi:hypothetical protein